jgi:ribosomal protein S18 acetylase RimI-like enzyme
MDAASVTTGRVSLRPATADDHEFLVALYGSTRDEELSQVVWPEGQRDAFVRMQFALQDAQYRTGNPDGSFEVIEVDGRPIGRLYVDRRDGEIRIIDLALVPESRGAGIGTRLLEGILDEAAGSGRTVRLHVEVHNRAVELYNRLGFVPVSDDGVYRLMVWRAP